MSMHSLYLSDERYVAALKRIRAQIARGSELEFEDSEEIGNKFTHCSWGLCSNSTEQWPDTEDRMFNDRPMPSKYRNGGQVCPFSNPAVSMGCFYNCRIFQHLQNLPTREEALQFYDLRIKEHE